MWISVSCTESPSQSSVIFEGIFPEARLICFTRPLQIVLGNFCATFDHLSNFWRFEQPEATFNLFHISHENKWHNLWYGCLIMPNELKNKISKRLTYLDNDEIIAICFASCRSIYLLQMMYLWVVKMRSWRVGQPIYS
jgi:hypothetical protein